MNINEDQLIILIDLGTTKNLISLSLVNKEQFVIYINQNIHNLIVINENQLSNQNKREDEKTKLLLVIFLQYYKKIMFDIL